MLRELVKLFRNKHVPPLKGYFPSFEEMDKKQRNFYEKLRKSIDQNQSLEIENYIGYVYVYIYEILDSKNPQKTIFQLQKIQKLYRQYEKLHTSCQFWISDCYVLLNQIETAVNSYPKKIGSRASTSSNSILSLKLHIGLKPTGEELLSLFGPKITKSFMNDIEKIKNLMDERIIEDYVSDINLLEKWSAKISPTKYSVFVGTFHLCYSDDVKSYSFSLVPEVEEYVKEITREAENQIRESYGVPKVGEGWISETKLYYLLKERFPSLKIIQHASPEWLGRQHLDIFFPEINLAIEYQGEQHDKPIEFFGGEKSLKETKKRDKNKKRLCNKNKVTLLEVREGFEEEKLFDLILKQYDEEII